MNKTGVNRNTKRQPHWNGKNPAQIPDAAPRSRTALDPVAYDNLIKQHGVRVKVYRSMYCPNVKSVDGGEHNIDCTLCNGSGFLDVDPIESVAYLANQNFQEEMTVEGYHDGNSVGGTFLGGIELQYFTRVDLMDFTQPFYERVLKSPSVSEVIAGTRAEIRIDFGSMVDVDETALFSNFTGMADFFEIVSGANITNFRITIDSESSTTRLSTDNNDNALFVRQQRVNSDTETMSRLVTRINAITTDAAGVTLPNEANNVSSTIRRTCIASFDGNVLILTRTENGQLLPLPEEISNSGADIIFSFAQGSNDTTVFTSQDNLKYDCRRVNVIIDKTGKQYHQDIDFRLSPQGNILWRSLNIPQPADGIIYSAHYESVIQYRAISAMHISRFAQVPDRSTGLVAQVKMPEQWMLQKEFLIIRRDEYGNEIKKTGIYGDIIANQPLNPAPPDTL